ncbi:MULTISPECIES: acyl-CoA dehydrogenase family protein [unclassified Pseudonocardia]|jgi:alkylation response protein AidB-like acyl-CoA dehydrogenase|uniref:acyl-CoA dehydrogenase family protein n=1 Tax=unclassified Pseudonocardia TaxID=2619320 RepID=UPI00096579B7|nr:MULTISPECIES: acyl-CoA dehydrogenase family protein [unclassified Pseudonocardia]MBN9101763.1 acyl-CoA dehydrogenase family protein [Pseudonocardia sp.]OJY49989.1 MAG: acyl-CoA dehydrogenase [Pseudonocardia sp. 73-21]
MQRDIFDAEHDAFRDLVRTFLTKEVVPFHEQWENDGQVDRAIWKAAGAAGLLGTDVPEEFGGGGVDDFRYNAIVTEEISAAGTSGLGFPLQNDVIAPYLLRLANDEQKQRWLPGFCSGEIITAIAMTEPGTGSDLQGITTNAHQDGNGDWILNGSKTFITNGILADLVIVVAKTDPEAGSRGFSLLVVERGMEGFERGRRLKKVGMKAQDTAELSFTDVRVPAANVLGELGQGFVYLMQNLAQERLSIAVGSIAGAAQALKWTLDYTKDRKAFGKPVATFQNTRFELAEMDTEITVTQVFVDKCISEHVAGRLSIADAAKAKWWASDVLKRVVDRCVQLHGGYGYMMEYPIAKAFVDSRVQSIYGGTNEIMKEIIGRSLVG